MRLGKHALESSHLQPVIQKQAELQIPTSQSDEVALSRPPPLQKPNVPNINCNNSHSPSYSDNLNTIQGDLNTYEGTLSGASFPSDLDLHFENHDLVTLGEVSLETFFENFLDVNFPTCLGEQYLGGYGASI